MMKQQQNTHVMWLPLQQIQEVLNLLEQLFQ